MQNNGDNNQCIEEGDGNRRRRFPPSRGGRGGNFGGLNKDREDGGRRYEVCLILLCSRLFLQFQLLNVSPVFPLGSIPRETVHYVWQHV